MVEFIDFQRYGITLKKLTHEDIEKVRIWRSDPEVSKFLATHISITPEMQEKWFSKIKNSRTDFYFIINVKGADIGVINLKDVDFSKKTGETGIFIGELEYQNNDYGLRAALAIHDFAFEVLNLETLHGTTFEANKRAMRLNKALGYEVLKNQEGIEEKAVQVTKDAYINATAKIKALINKLYS